MDVLNIVSTVAVSAGVSGIVSFSLRTVIKAKIESRYNVELENLRKQHKLEIERQKIELKEITGRRMVAYQRIGSLVYRTRNMSRDLQKQISQDNLSLVDEFADRVKELEEALYEYRIDLQRDHLFDGVHKFKNIAINFGIRASDAKYVIQQGQDLSEQNILNELKEIYVRIDELHHSIQDKFSSYGTNGDTRHYKA